MKKILCLSMVALLLIMAGPFVSASEGSAEEQLAKLQAAYDQLLEGYQALQAEVEELRGPATTPIPVSDNDGTEEREIQPGEVFQSGSYIVFMDVKILYTGDNTFQVTNNGDGDIIVTPVIVGVKKDGTYEAFSWPAFGGLDQEQYEKDMEENGWAIEQYTKTVRAGKTLDATLTAYDFGEGFPPNDIDGDGYYDLVFNIDQHTEEGDIFSWGDDNVSPVYKLPAE